MSSEEPPVDDGLDLDEASFDDFEKKKATLGDLWRDNPVVKIGIIGVAAVAILGTIVLFGAGEKPVDPSMVPEGSEVAAPPGTEQSTPAYVEAVQEQNEVRTEEALREGGSSLPTPIEPPVGRLTITENESPDEDPLQRWRKLQEERLQREMLRSQAVAETEAAAPVDAKSNDEVVQSMADAMSQQMQSILESRGPKPIQYKAVTGPEWLQQLRMQQEQEALAAAQAAAAGGGGTGGTGTGTDAGAEEEATEQILIPAAKILYAQLLLEANTDVPGPVLAQLVSGPLAGSRMLGSFQRQKELLTLNFNSVVVDGIAQPIDAIAVDPNTTLTAMATDVDHHYLKRIVLPMAASFIEGLSEAVSDAGVTSVTVEGGSTVSESADKNSEQEVASGIQEAGERLREIVDEMADDTEVTIIIARGTPMGVLFMQPVLKSDGQM